MQHEINKTFKNSILLPFLELPNIIKYIETENRMVIREADRLEIINQYLVLKIDSGNGNTAM